MMRTSDLRMVAACVLTLAALTGAAYGQTAPGQQLVVNHSYNPEDLSPWNYTTLATVDIWEHFMEPLTMIDRRGNVVGVVAESWQMVSPSEWVLKVRRGMRFHDPKYGELTAEDVKFSLDGAVRQGEVVRRLLPKVIQDGSVEVVDRYTVRWKLAAPGTGGIPNWMSLLHVTSKAYVEGEGKDVFKQRPMGTGPYRFVEWLTNQRLVGEAFKDYWGPKPAFERVVWRIIPDRLTAKNALLAGEIDVYQSLPAEFIPEVQRNPKLRTVEVVSARMLFMVINAAEPPLDNKLVRQALNHAVDKKAIVEQLYRGRAVALRAPMQEVIPELNRNLQGYPYDPQKARDLLKQAGYKGETIRLTAPINRYASDKELGEAVAGMLQKVGVNVEFKAVEWGTYAAPLFAGKASGVNLMGMGNIVLLPEWVYNLWLLPGGQGEVYTKGRPANWVHDVDQVNILPKADARRRQLLEKLQAEALDYAPWILLINLKDVYALSSKIDWEPFPTETRNFKDAKVRN